jgi:signal transduction histidine kinase
MTQQPARWDDATVATHAPPTRPPDTWAWAAVVVAVVDTVAVVASLVVALTNDLPLNIVESGAWLNLVAGTVFPLLAALMLRRGPESENQPLHQRRLAILFVSFGVLCAGTLALHVYADHGLQVGAPLALPVAWVSSWLWIGVPCGILLVLLWFPTGDVPGPRWRIATAALVVAYSALWVSIAIAPGTMTDFRGEHPNPLGWQFAGPALEVIGGLGFAVLAMTAVATVASVAWRYHSGDPVLRSQLRWLVVTVLINVVAIAIPVPDALAGASAVLNATASFLLPVALGVALVRRDGLVLPRVLLYGVLSVLLLGAYLAVVGVAEALFGPRVDRWASLVAVGIVAVAAAPLRARLQRAVDRLVYGDRGDPYAALTDLGRRLSDTPGDLLGEVVGAVAHALRCSYAAVVLAGDITPTAAVGTPTREDMTYPLTVRGETVGALVISRRSGRGGYGDRDVGLVNDLARHIAVAAHAATLTRDLQRSRESLVIAREEERRRIRRDLHDGLGPALAGIALGIDAARRNLERDPADATTAAAALTELKDEMLGSISDVRRLVYDLRPPALDRLGLVPAVEEYAARLGERGALSVRVSSPHPLPPLPAAVEVAAYRIATEALTNAARHSGARTSSVSFCIDALSLRLQVDDDGVGLPPVTEALGVGLGMSAMTERAAELGGSCLVGAGTRGGTSVVALLPLRALS